MKKPLSQLVMSLSRFVSVIAGCAVGITGVLADEADKPSIEFTETEHDFGVIKNDKQADHVFTFKNTGKGALTIQEVKTNCGCSAVNWKKEPVAPGQAGTVTVQLDSAKIQGTFSKTVTVLSNDPALREVNLILRGRFISDVNWEPSPNFVFGNLVGEASATRTLNVWFYQPTKILEVVSSEDLFKASVTEVEKSKRFTVEVRTVPPMKPGWHGAQIKLRTDNPKFEWLTSDAMVMVVPVISCYPPEALFLRNDKGWIGSSLVVRHNGGGKFHILRTETSIKGMQIKVQPLVADSSYQLVVEQPAPDAVIEAEGEITVYTDDKEFSVIRVPVHMR